MSLTIFNYLFQHREQPQAAGEDSSHHRPSSAYRRKLGERNCLKHELTSEVTSRSLILSSSSLSSVKPGRPSFTWIQHYHKLSFPWLSDEMSVGRKEAFETFRRDYDHNDTIEENKQTLKLRFMLLRVLFC